MSTSLYRQQVRQRSRGRRRRRRRDEAVEEIQQAVNTQHSWCRRISL